MGQLRRAIAATVCGLALWGGAAIAALPPRHQSERAQSPEVNAFLKPYREGERLFNLQTAAGYREAIAQFEAALASAEQVGATDGVAAAALYLGVTHHQLGERRASLERYEIALAAFQALGNRELEARTLSNMGTVYSRLGDRRTALEHHERAIAIHEETGDRANEAAALNNAGSVYDRLGDREAALDYYERALAIARETNDRPGEAIVLSNIGLVYDNLGDREAALDYYERALPILRDVGDRAGEAIALGNTGAVYTTLGQVDRALESFEAALAIQQEVGARGEEAGTLTSIGSAYNALGDREAALDYYDRALALRRETGDRNGEATALNNIGLVHTQTGDREAALDYHAAALEIMREVGDRTGEASTLNNIGGAYEALGDWREALNYFEQGLAIRHEVGDRDGEAISLSNIGVAYRRLGDLRAALDYFERARPIHRETGARAEYAIALNNIGSTYSALGEPATALDYYERALAIREEVGDRAGQAATLSNIGLARSLAGDSQRALDYYERALPLFVATGNRTGEATALGNMAFAHGVLGDLEIALDRIDASIAIVEQLRSEIASTSLRTTYFATVQEYYQLRIDILMRLHERDPEAGYDVRAFNTSERTRARTLIELLAEANLDLTADLDPALRDRERALRQRLQSLDAQRVARLQTASGVEIEAIVADFDRRTTAVLRELDALAARIRQTDPAYAALQYPEPLTLAQVQQRVLDDETTLLQYSLAGDRSYVWIVTRDGFESVTLPGRDTIETAAREFYASVDRAGNPLATARKARQLGNLVFAPVAELLATDRLLVVPDGALHQIPFSALALPDAEDYQPLLTRHEIVSAPSVTAIATNRETMADRPLAPGRLAVLADPVFTADDPRLTGVPAPETATADRGIGRTLRDFDLRSLARLPYTKTEADRLLELARGDRGNADRGNAAFDFEASYDWVTGSGAKRYQYIHFATHGFANSENPELSGLVLSLVDANGQPQNGFLRLADIFNLEMPAEMVVLSACQTGLGENVGGEGVVGLTRGLMYAGAERTVLSLWNVNDEKTADLMVKFYAGIWEDGLTPAAALRQAQLAMWEAGEHPYYWAAFGLQGEWRK
ncbi:MAG: tetratricopeptide repeat protein [Geitlerinemataceae cyanobacterium]